MSEGHYVTSSAGVRSPGILYGTAWKKDETERLVTEALREGFRGIDTACQPKHYDEAAVGRGVAACLVTDLAREDLYLQTKFTPLSGHDPARVPYDPQAPLGEQVAQSFAASLRNLRTEYVDCLVLHSPLTDAGQMAEVWQAMEDIVRSGAAKQLGISNCYWLDLLESLHAAAGVKPAVVQNRFYRETRYDRDIRAFCRERTPVQVLFRYLTQEGVVPLTGTTNRRHMREDLAIFEFALTDEERDAVTALLV